MQSSGCSFLYKAFLCFLVSFASPLVLGQQSPATDASASSSGNQPEIQSRDVTTTFKASVNLVTVHAVVRDAQGHAVGNLTRDDFHLFDNGKPQAISRFSAETTKPDSGGDVENQFKSSRSGPGESVERFVPPNRYIAFVVDDLHGEFNDLVNVKQAAERIFATSLQPTDRIAIFTTSGVGVLDFTDDQARARNP